ncbi:MAG: Peptidyl-prolyl cis-trans isomerase PpiD (EC [uncultured Sulfurovum sp.]|uniref:Peptidyl-prolyl cis-trans isomerase PpiD (EC) n=1 Tax=uncultured Sulfurovum sp. TaxID=269237 RepID=A0A6S6TYT7_9BACT|nr:MAG: Peptidyl-prolyl cis-trans isomerase PpiD (EC [uncultured Sulfurovum sp.]
MISWMQKHNKYLVWTIWVATIAFIGAGFVGWGSYNLSGQAGSVAKVGDVEIKQTKLNMAYTNLYTQYNQMFQGKLDDAKAKELGLAQRAFATIEAQAKILSFAKDAGIVASDSELMTKLESIQGFQKDGVFDKEIYTNYLKSQRLKAKDFEATLNEEIIITKTFALLQTSNLPLEIETIGAALNVSDKVSYKVLSTADIDYISDDTKVKAFWETQKENYMTTKMYDLGLVWTKGDAIVAMEKGVKEYYEANSFNYTNKEGKQLDYEEAKEQVTKDFKLKLTKKAAQKDYIAFKKGNLKSTENVTLPVGDLKLTKEVWDDIKTKSIGDIIKPKVVSDKYVTVKINSIKEPTEMSYEEAKKKVTRVYDKQAKKEALLTLAESTLENIENTDMTVSDFISLQTNDNLKSLNSQETLQFVQKLFTSNKEKGIISVLDKVIVYNIVEQKILPMDENQTNIVEQTLSKVKKETFETNLIKMLDAKYPTEVYMKGLVN